MIFAKKSLGQNFLTSPRVVDAIATAGNLSPKDTVIEIGPGKGVLTKALLLSGATVKAIEKDDRLIPILEKEFSQEIANGKLELIHGDIMEMDVEKFVEAISNNPSKTYKIIANIPYYITGALIRVFLSASKKPEEMILMVQKEVANRIIARDGKESLLSLSVKAYAKPELVMNVSRGNFFPIPNVDSAVIRLAEIKNPFKDAESEERFFQIIKAGFAQKRKKLAKNLATIFPKETITKIFQEIGLEENVRAEDMNLRTWISMTEKIGQPYR